MEVQTVVGAAALALAGLVYLAPALVAARRDVVGLPRLLQLNVLLGWTVAVWVHCLLAALRRPPRPAAWQLVAPLAAHRSDRVPDWLAELKRADGTWSALPRDTAPLRIDDDTERR